jgi:hypothetical protein
MFGQILLGVIVVLVGLVAISFGVWAWAIWKSMK